MVAFHAFRKSRQALILVRRPGDVRAKDSITWERGWSEIVGCNALRHFRHFGIMMQIGCSCGVGEVCGSIHLMHAVSINSAVALGCVETAPVR